MPTRSGAVAVPDGDGVPVCAGRSGCSLSGGAESWGTFDGAAGPGRGVLAEMRGACALRPSTGQGDGRRRDGIRPMKQTTRLRYAAAMRRNEMNRSPDNKPLDGDELTIRRPYEKPRIVRVDLALAETLSEGHASWRPIPDTRAAPSRPWRAVREPIRRRTEYRASAVCRAAGPNGPVRYSAPAYAVLCRRFICPWPNCRWTSVRSVSPLPGDKPLFQAGGHWGVWETGGEWLFTVGLQAPPSLRRACRVPRGLSGRS